MNDRFKFRIAVYERQQNNMPWTFVEYIDPDNQHWGLNQCGDIISDSSYSAHYTRKNAPDSVHRVYEPEQCTGLKDENGKLIYEGDVVKYSCGRKGVVSFGKYTCCFAVGWENIDIDLMGWYLDDYYEPDDCGRLRINFDNTHDSITEEDDGDFEIIGNIHKQAEQKDVK